MRNLLPKTLFLITLLLFPFTIYAHDDFKVCEWVKQVLLKTLAIDYNYTKEDAELVRPNYTANAWTALDQFLGNAIEVIKEKHLTIHPVFSQEPIIVDQGVYAEIPYWRVDEVVSIPEFNILIAFSMIVIQINTSNNQSLLIQSIDMIKKENP